MVSHLLPTPDLSPLCSDHTRAIAVRPMGTGLRLDRIVLVTLATPWPKPALGHPLLKPAAAALTASSVASRLFAACPTAAAPESTIEIYERDGLAWRHWRRSGSTPSEVADAVAELADLPLGAAVDDATAVRAPVMLVCTQGSHDQCCGVQGEQLAADIERSRPDIAVRRVSHTGGHRFAPTLLALPSGTMWAWCDLELVDRIASGRETAQDVIDHSRGWLGAGIGAAQVAEAAARIAVGGPPAETPIIEASPLDDGRWTVTIGARRIDVEVSVGREVPSIACEAPGGQPAKTAREFAFDLLEEPPR